MTGKNQFVASLTHMHSCDFLTTLVPIKLRKLRVIIMKIKMLVVKCLSSQIPCLLGAEDMVDRAD